MTTFAAPGGTLVAFTVEMLDDNATISDTVALAVAAYDVDPAAAWAQLCDHLEELCDTHVADSGQRRADAGELIEQVVRDPRTPDDTIGRLSALVADAGLPHRHLRPALTNPTTTSATIAAIYERHGASLMRSSGGLAHPNTSRAVIRDVIGDNATAVDVKALLRRDDCDTDLVRWLSERTDSENGAKRLAHRHDLTAGAYQRYAHHHASSVRCAVAMNQAAPEHVLGRLAGDERDDVRHYVAENPSTPSAVLVGLTNDANQGVAYHAYRQLRARGELTITLAD